ncbi:MAG: hypothetical protein ACOH5I_18250 [Oligoflexus sp.]
MKNQGIYWLCEQPSELHRAKAELLAEIDYEISFFPNLETLLVGLASKRVSIIIVSAEGQEDEIIKAVHALASNPAIQGARLILCSGGESNRILHYAAGQGFRDIMQLEWEDHIWLERFEFSTSGQEGDINRKTVRSEQPEQVKFFLPARVVWLNQEQMWIESRARPPQGSNLQLGGALARDLNSQQKIHLHVTDHAKSNLVFRFSEAIIADWQANETLDQEQVSQTFDLIQKLDRGERPKVFLAVQSPALRNTILKYLSPLKYEVHTALQKRSVIMEPKFFSPHLVFIEDRICSGDSMSRFQEMVVNLPEKSTVVVVGGREDLSSFRNFSAGRRLEALARIPKNLTEIIEKQYLPSTHFERQSHSFYLPSDHPYSFAEIELPSRIIAWSDQDIEVALPIPIENFGLARVDSAILSQVSQKDIYVKVTTLKPSTEHGFVAVCRLCTLNPTEQSHWEEFLLKNHSHHVSSSTKRKRSNS